MNKLHLLLLPLLSLSLFLVACGDKEKSTEVGDDSPSAAVNKLFQTPGSGLVAFASETYKEEDGKAVVVSLACQKVPGEKGSVLSGTLTSIMEEKDGKWSPSQTPDEVAPKLVQGRDDQKAIEEIANGLKEDLPKDCLGV